MEKMSLSERTKLCEEFMHKCLELLIQKGDEYVVDTNDSFKEIREAALDIRVLPSQGLYIHMAKHFNALRSALRHPERERLETMTSRLVDLANYCALMYALIQAESNP